MLNKLIVSESMRIIIESLQCLLSTRHLGCMNVLLYPECMGYRSGEINCVYVNMLHRCMFLRLQIMFLLLFACNLLIYLIAVLIIERSV